MDVFDEHVKTLEALPIPDQVARFRQSIDYACAAIHQATLLGKHLLAASHAGVLTPAESREFTEAILTDARALQAGLVMFLSGQNTQREILEQLRCIFMPGKRPGYARQTIDDHLAMAWSGLPCPEPDAAFYWDRLLEYR